MWGNVNEGLWAHKGQMFNQVGVTQAWRLQRCKWPTWDNTYLCLDVTFRLQWGKWPRGHLIAEERWSRREVSRSRGEVSTTVGNESGDCKPPMWSCWLHFRSCQKPSPVKNENFVRVHLQSWSSNTLATWCEQPTHWKRCWWWERLKAEGEEGDKGWMVGWHHRFNGHELGQTLGDGDRQGGLVCCSPRGRKGSDMTWQLKKQTKSPLSV